MPKSSRAMKRSVQHDKTLVAWYARWWSGKNMLPKYAVIPSTVAENKRSVTLW